MSTSFVPEDNRLSTIERAVAHPLFYDLLLNRVSTFGPRRFRETFERLPSAKSVVLDFENSKKIISISKPAQQQISQLKILLEERTKGLFENKVFMGVLADLEWESESGNAIVSLQDTAYPKLLKEIYDAPQLLFVKGNLDLLNRTQVSIVGSRGPSQTGLRDTYAFSKSLAQSGLVITSGLAMGIDAAAHQGAIDAKPKSTVAVLAHGLDAIYPKRNQKLAQKILDGKGTLVSEFPIGIKPRPEYFPRRNRIISGVAKGVLVMEAAVKSGSLITAYSALNQNREVFAIPGSIHNPMARGCHRLIKEGAKLVETSQDILEEFPDFTEARADASVPNKPLVMKELSTSQTRILAVLDYEGTELNQIAESLKWPIDKVSSNLTMLELKGLVFSGEYGYRKA